MTEIIEFKPDPADEKASTEEANVFIETRTSTRTMTRQELRESLKALKQERAALMANFEHEMVALTQRIVMLKDLLGEKDA